MDYNPLDDLDVMALTVWAEARGEPIKGQIAVAWVIRNRWEHPRWWSRNRDSIPDDTIAAVVKDPYQFSCWNPNDPQRKQLENPRMLNDLAFMEIREICRMVICNEVFDPTGGADHYCTTKVAKYTSWAKGRIPIKVIGRHSFYRIEL
jgi:N-acetylmuramoyl-L-alanine amidase